MNDSNNQFGRQRIKKGKPPINSVSEQQKNQEYPQKHPPEQRPPIDKKDEAQLPIELPLSAPIVSIQKPDIVHAPKPGPPIVPKPAQRPAAREDNSARPRQEGRRPEKFQQRQSPERKTEVNQQMQRPRERQTRKFGSEAIKTRVSIIIPAYNEEDNIKPLLDQFNDIIGRAGKDWEVIIVDDGSTDKTAERARDASIRYHWLRVISYPHNRGLTAALNTGFQNARGSIFVFYPADLQYHPQEIPKMVVRIERGADIVTGWKQGKYSKRIVSLIYNWLCRALFKTKVHDLNSVKAFKREVLEKIVLRHDWHRYLVVLAAEQGFNIDEVKVTVYPRHSGHSKFGTGRILGGVLDLLSVKFQVSFTKKPFRFFGTWGIISIFLGFITGLIAIYLRYFTTHGSRTWLYLVILFVLSGLMLFSLGFLAEVIVALRDEIESLKPKNR